MNRNADYDHVGFPQITAQYDLAHDGFASRYSDRDDDADRNKSDQHEHARNDTAASHASHLPDWPPSGTRRALSFSSSAIRACSFAISASIAA